MERIPTPRFLASIDEELVTYSEMLMEKGFTSTRTLAHLTVEDLTGKLFIIL